MENSSLLKILASTFEIKLIYFSNNMITMKYYEFQKWKTHSNL